MAALGDRSNQVWSLGTRQGIGTRWRKGAIKAGEIDSGGGPGSCMGDRRDRWEGLVGAVATCAKLGVRLKGPEALLRRPEAQCRALCGPPRCVVVWTFLRHTTIASHTLVRPPILALWFFVHANW